MVPFLKVYKRHEIKESLTTSVFPELFIHTLGAAGKPPTAVDLFFIKCQGGQSRSQELLAMRMVKTLGTSSTFLMLLITKGNQRWARFKVNPL